MKMRKILIISAAILTFCTAELSAAAPIEYQDYDLDMLLHEITEPKAPVITDDYIIFTVDTNYRYAGIAFDFEDYQIIHPFQVLTQTDDEEKKTRRHLFYCYERHHNLTEIKYRLVLDGLWTTDPHNPNKIYDENVNLYFSKVDVPDGINIYTNSTKTNFVHFIYKGKSGQRIRLGGTFTNWDPWIYELNETSPGLYELDLPLASGKYYYNYYIGLTPVLDNTNPEKIYTNDGRSASVIVVD